MKMPKMFHERVSKKRRKFNLNRVVSTDRGLTRKVESRRRNNSAQNLLDPLRHARLHFSRVKWREYHYAATRCGLCCYICNESRAG